MSLAADEIATFRTNLDGPIFLPGEPEYENARRVWNARIERHPAIVLRPSDVDDVRTAVRLTRSVDRSLTVKAGGHHISGSAVHDDAVLLDLSALTGIRTDADSVTVGGGATWGAVDRATAAIGRATPGGQDPNIGVAGLTLGGGVGWLSRRYGLACDNTSSRQPSYWPMDRSSGRVNRPTTTSFGPFAVVGGGSGSSPGYGFEHTRSTRSWRDRSCFQSNPLRASSAIIAN